MLEFLKHNRKTIFRCFLILLIIFEALAMIPAFLTGEARVFLMAGITAFSVAVFATMVMVVFGLIEIVRENTFFRQYPYKFIRQNATRIEYVNYSKWYFAKRFYSFLVDDEEFQASYHSDLIKWPYINLLLIFRKVPNSDEQIVDGIAYKEEQLDESGLIKRIKNIVV